MLKVLNWIVFIFVSIKKTLKVKVEAIYTIIRFFMIYLTDIKKIFTIFNDHIKIEPDKEIKIININNL